MIQTMKKTVGIKDHKK